MVRKTKYWKGYALSCVIFLFAFAAADAQRRNIDFNTRGEIYNELFRRPQWEFIAAVMINERAQLVHLTNAKYRLSALPQSSFEFGVQRLGPLQDNFGLAIGFRVGIVGRNAQYTAPYHEVGYTYLGDYAFNGVIAREKDLFYLSVPVQLEYRHFINAHRMLTGIIGVSMKFSSFNATGTGDMDIMEVRLKGNRKPYVNIHTGPGIGFLLKNKNILKIGLNLNYDPSYIATGRFFVETRTSYDEGTYTVRGNYIGLSAAYAFTKHQ